MLISPKQGTCLICRGMCSARNYDSPVSSFAFFTITCYSSLIVAVLKVIQFVLGDILFYDNASQLWPQKQAFVMIFADGLMSLMKLNHLTLMICLKGTLLLA